MSNRTIDDVFVKNLRAGHTATASEAAGAAVNLGAAGLSVPNVDPMAERDVTAIAGTPTLDGVIQGSDDGTTWSTAGTFAQMTAVGRQIISLKRFRQYRSGATTIGGGTPSLTYSDKLIGIASERPVTQP